jgi:heme exporter protein B
VSEDTPVHIPSGGTLGAMRAIFMRDLRLALRRRADTAAALFFFVIVASLFPLGVGPEPALLRTMAAGVLWVAALLASMLSLGRLFADDHADGTLEQLLLSVCPLPLIVLSKMAAHWLCSGLMLSLVAPLLALQFDLPGEAIGVLLVTLLLGTPLLSLIGGIGAALTVGVRGASVLLSVLVDLLLLLNLLLLAYTFVNLHPVSMVVVHSLFQLLTLLVVLYLNVLFITQILNLITSQILNTPTLTVLRKLFMKKYYMLTH